MRKYLILMAVLLLPATIMKAEFLSLNAAIDSALSNNFNVNIAKNALQTAEINNTPGNAGALPYVNLGAGTSFQTMFGNDETATVGQFTGGISAGWDIYNGGKNSLNRTILKENVNQYDLALKNEIIQTTYKVCAAYYYIVKMYKNLDVTHNLIAYDSIVAHIAEIAFESGNKAKTDLLLAKVDLNSARQTEIGQYSDIHFAKLELNGLMVADDIGFDYDVADNFNIAETLPDSTATRSSLLKSNPEIAEMDKRLELASLAYELEKTGLKPTINIAGGYNFYEEYANDEFAFLHGPNISAQISMPLYDAGETKRKTNAAKLEEQTMQIEKDQMLDELLDSFDEAYIEYRDKLRILTIERETYKMAEENLNLNIELFREGETTVIEVRQARTELIASASRLSTYEYDIKIAELKLRLLTGTL